MNRREQLREYWDAQLPTSEWLYLVDAAKHINRGLARPLISRRSLQRRAREGRLKVIGGTERAIREYRVRRVDLIEFLVDLDIITGNEPPPPREPRAPRGPKSKRRKKQPAGQKPSRYQQRSLFEE